ASDEPFLKRKAPVRSVEPCTQYLIARGHEGRFDAKRCGESAGHRGERLAGLPGLRAHEMDPEVPVAEPKPGFSAERFDGLECVPGLVGSAPSALLVGHVCECIEHAVEIGRYGKSQDLE